MEDEQTAGANSKPMYRFLKQTAIVWKTTLGSIVAWEIARWSGSTHPYLAPLTLILCIQATVEQSLRFAIYRSIGTVLGVLLIGMFAKDIPVTAWSLGIALFVSTGIMKALRINDTIIHQVALSILFVLYFENQSSGYARDRVVDTLIGSIVAVLFIMFVVPTNGKASGGTSKKGSSGAGKAT
ncbi:FUSC family protein [Alicyclobacillus fastidiosus]|uniref:Aromatic acid exporter family protein n=1 Tax=Alicyclobacillus fastidiosus TaxID=392011 RepID=A0ABV5AES7_9BACL|nr:FUSC family protein [Alicyclobacillus fastidiosus]WEH09487.1 aromatic acid exporter family protein [Alicyclobacillus fastidiosus]